MHKTLTFIGVAAVALLAAGASRAQPPRGGPGGPPRGGPPDLGQLFERLDVNKDGKIAKDEAPDEHWRRLSAADADGDGAVTKEEFATRMRSLREQLGPGRGGPPERAERGRREEPGPGRGGPPERAERGRRERGPDSSTLRTPEGGPSQLFDRLDKDQDGSLSKQEFLAGMERLRAAQSRLQAPTFRGRRGAAGRDGVTPWWHRGPVPGRGAPWSARGHVDWFGRGGRWGAPAGTGYGGRFHGPSGPPWGGRDAMSSRTFDGPPWARGEGRFPGPGAGARRTSRDHREADQADDDKEQ